jgi:protein-tyrosine phosphatase
MFRVVEGLFISSLESASQNELLSNNQIRCVISVGCKSENADIASPDNIIEYHSFPHVLDRPETVLLGILVHTNDVIQRSLSKNMHVLVHCVYGQSRSASVIASYLMSTGLNLEDSVQLVKTANPSMCINPGFLSQLHFISQSSLETAPYFSVVDQHRFETLLLNPSSESSSSSSSSGIRAISSNKRVRDDDGHILSHPFPVSARLWHSRSLETILNAQTSLKDILICKACKGTLASGTQILLSSCNAAEFVDEYQDAFWAGYRSARSKGSEAPCVLPHKGVVAVYPSAWMLDCVQDQVAALRRKQQQQQTSGCAVLDASTSAAGKESKKKGTVSSSESSSSNATTVSGGLSTVATFTSCSLSCPTCLIEVGSWRSRGLNLIGEYNLCDLFSFHSSSVHLKRHRSIPASAV